jgi:hypothetical protein
MLPGALIMGVMSPITGKIFNFIFSENVWYIYGYDVSNDEWIEFYSGKIYTSWFGHE